jgi:transposase-like protein
MASPQVINLTSLIDDAKCYELIRHHRWPEGVRCTACSSAAVIRHGHDERHRQRCKDCGARFDDLTGTVLAGHHQPLRVLCLYFMGLNLSNQQIAKELSLNDDDVHDMASHLREGLVAGFPRRRWTAKSRPMLRDNQNHARCDNQASLPAVSVVQRKLHPEIMMSGCQAGVKPGPLGPRLWRLWA